jgi:acylphosphatase
MSSYQFHILFIGRVQGVGFRFTMQSLAKQYSLSGWVKNLPDGRVEAVVQSSEEQWEALSSDIKSRFDVQDMIVQKEKISSMLKSFTVAY